MKVSLKPDEVNFLVDLLGLVSWYAVPEAQALWSKLIPLSNGRVYFLGEPYVSEGGLIHFKKDEK